MNKYNNINPWSFVIELDKEKCKKNGYEIDRLYDYIDDCINKFGYDIKRIDINVWKSSGKDKIVNQYVVLMMLTENKYVMMNIKSITSYEYGVAAIDYLKIIRRLFPERFYD